MATARISESLWTCAKRRALESALRKAGHRWPDGRTSAPMSGGECLARILALLDGRGHSDGDMRDLDAEAIESAAGWDGKPGALLKALVDTGWIDATDEGPFWHDYGAFNSLAMSRREAGARGGKRSVEVRRERYGDAKPAPKQPEANHRSNGRSNTKQDPEASPKQTHEQSGSGSGSGSVVRERTGGGDGGCSPRTARPADTTTPSPSAPAEADPQTAGLARTLHRHAGGGAPACLAALQEALAEGVPVERIVSAVADAPPARGASVYDWKRDLVTAWKAEQPAKGRGEDYLTPYEDDVGWRPEHWPGPRESMVEYQARTGSDVRYARAAFAKARRIGSWDTTVGISSRPGVA